MTKQPRDIITVVGATSGDTGSAAIYGLRGKKDVSVFILYPTGRISPIQEEQMTTVEDENVHTLSVNGTFDDCQDIVKLVFGDKEFNDKYHVGAVNSINWARILAQQTYYFYSYFNYRSKLKLLIKSDLLFLLGNFGDILAGYYAYRMGLPVDKLIIATNENDILDRFIKSGEYAKEQEVGVKATYSPAMDILISSNFERLLWYLIRDNVPEVNKSDEKAGQLLNDWMKQLKEQGKFKVPAEVIDAARQVLIHKELIMTLPYKPSNKCITSLLINMSLILTLLLVSLLLIHLLLKIQSQFNTFLFHCSSSQILRGCQ